MTDDECKALSARAAALAADNERLRRALGDALLSLRAALAVVAAAEQRCEPLRRAIGLADSALKNTGQANNRQHQR